MSVKGKLIEHAESVFRRQGFNGASVQDITSAAGVPKGSFYNHFKSKQELASEIVRRYGNATDFSMLKREGSAHERLRAHFAAQAERTSSTGVEFGCLLVTMASETPTAGVEVGSAVRDSITAWAAALAEVIRQGQQAGEFRSEASAEDLATFLIDAFEGGALRGKATGDATASMRSLDLALDALAR
ncbi:TetR/AcrR family transcriptional regulator [Actinoallomurus rhizosphaericola]|uniref:TetR/AcrR family transcriptional regulator n=1 Tax=Actinoallomurus rhizosphaericola TaxID=2952536 RepID=UPI0020934226|nr:TetR/AcrR family transcriptional regulator [Actinoallomurus rhizosphaericola]MCO6000169.1 TetR/AcrR family transcriptional regulator [Actinoallomurus rhizosphaericola]